MGGDDEGGVPAQSQPPLCDRQVDANTKNVFGQPRLRASLRDLRSPRKSYKSTIEDDLKKLIIMDSAAPEPERAGVSRALSWVKVGMGRGCPFVVGRGSPHFLLAPA